MIDNYPDLMCDLPDDLRRMANLPSEVLRAEGERAQTLLQSNERGVSNTCPEENQKDNDAQPNLPRPEQLISQRRRGGGLLHEP